MLGATIGPVVIGGVEMFTFTPETIPEAHRNPPLPATMAKGTPWADVTETGDSHKTNAWLGKLLVSNIGYRVQAAKLYAGGQDPADPQVSPINGDFHGFPPDIPTTGTRGLFLSNPVRTIHNLRQAGVEAEL